ncbi:MAG: type II secretion system F family protein [Planctomycetota bacterium]|nr:type II secretion system F family protein [Planctomycetota bacterium]
MLILAAIDLRLVVSVTVFLAVVSFAWFAIDFFNRDEQGVAESRLDMMNSSMRKVADAKESRKEMFSRVLEQASPAVAKHLQPKNEAEVSKLKSRLAEAGFRTEGASGIFLTVKVMVAIGGLFLAGGTTALTMGLGSAVMLRAVLGGGIAFFLPEMALDFMRSRRKKQITLGLPDALDLLVVSVEAGLGLDQGIKKVSDEMQSSYRVLSDELQLSTLHLQMGRARASVLQDLGYRTGVEDLRTLASLLIQADKFGSGVAQALRVQSESMRIKRQQIAEEKAAKTAVKLIFPLVLFIFPGVFVVLVGPAAIQMVREMFPAMQGK